jgi:hypothetical protein
VNRARARGAYGNVLWRPVDDWPGNVAVFGHLYSCTDGPPRPPRQQAGPGRAGASSSRCSGRAARRRPRRHHQQGLVDPPHPATPLAGAQCGRPRVRLSRPLRDTESRPKLSLGRGSKGPEPPACARRVRALVAFIGADGAQRAALAHAQHGIRPHDKGAQSDDAR